MLARLFDIPGIRDARVECSGTYFLVEGDDAGVLERALPAIQDVLGPGARCVHDPERRIQLSTRTKGEPWFSPRDIRGLSYIEARLLSTRIADGVAQVLTLDGAAADVVAEAVRAEIVTALDHAHDTGGQSSSGWFWEAWPRIAALVAARLDGALAGASCAVLERALVAQSRS